MVFFLAGNCKTAMSDLSKGFYLLGKELILGDQLIFTYDIE